MAPEATAVPPPKLRYHRIGNVCATVFITLMLMCYIIWSAFLLAMQPKPPTYTLNSGKIRLNLNRSRLSARWHLVLIGTNLNRHFDIHHHRLDSDIVYLNNPPIKVITLARTLQPPFVLMKRNRTKVGFKFSVWKKHLSYLTAQEMTSSDQVGFFGFRLHSRIGFVSKLLPTKVGSVQVTCAIPHESGGIGGSGYAGKSCNDVTFSRSYTYEGGVVASYFVIAVLVGVKWLTCATT